MKKLYERFGIDPNKGGQDNPGVAQYVEQENFKPKGELTIVYFPTVDFYSDTVNQRPQNLMKAFAELGVNVIFINNSYAFYQVDDIECPYPELPNFHIARIGVNTRHLLKGRIVYWINHSKFHTSMASTHANLVVFDVTEAFRDQMPGVLDYKKEMELQSDIGVASSTEMSWHFGAKFRHSNVVIVPDDGNKTWKEKAIKIMDRIENTPNRKPPLY